MSYNYLLPTYLTANGHLMAYGYSVCESDQPRHEHRWFLQMDDAVAYAADSTSARVALVILDLTAQATQVQPVGVGS